MKRDEVVISSVDDGERNSADHSLRHGAGRLSRIPFLIDPHMGMAFREQPTQFGTGQNDRTKCAEPKRYAPIGWTRHHDDSRQCWVGRCVGHCRYRSHRSTDESDTTMAKACMGYGRGYVISLQVAEGAKAPGLTMTSGIVRKNIEGASADAFGQSNDVRMVLRRGQPVHEDDDGSRFAFARPGAGRELHTVTRQQPRALNGYFGHFAPFGSATEASSLHAVVTSPADLPKPGVSTDHLRVIRSQWNRAFRSRTHDRSTHWHRFAPEVLRAVQET
jgi:hypothetical protein